MKRLLILPLLLLLAACDEKEIKLGVPPVQRQALSEQVPPTLFVCADRPDDSKVKTNRDVANFIADLDEAHEDCKTRLEAAGQIVRGTK